MCPAMLKLDVCTNHLITNDVYIQIFSYDENEMNGVLVHICAHVG